MNTPPQKTPDDLTTLTIAQAGLLLRDGQISPVEFTRAHLARIEHLEPTLNAFITRTADLAISHAQAAERDIMQGAYRGPLHGIPLGLKDLFETRGVRTTAGSKFFENYVPTSDSQVVRRLVDAAGMIPLGKLNMHEWAFGATNLNYFYGACNNPWDVSRISGGSSGGSGVALAAGMVMGAMGSDTRGSIRIPASFCGVTGLKPTYGRVSLRGVIPLSWSLDHAGPMARTAYDVALMLDALAGYDSADPLSVDYAVDNYAAKCAGEIRGWVVGVPDDDTLAMATPEIGAAVRAAANVLAEHGVELREVELKSILERGTAASRFILGGDAAAFHRERLRDQPESFSPDVRARFTSDSERSMAEYATARHTARMVKREIDQLFHELCLLVLPTTTVIAPRRQDEAEMAVMLNSTLFTSSFNIAGVPALSVPCGFSSAGMPIGMQIVAPAWREDEALRAGHVYQQSTD
jgi:aspartyl-tRNA(Asn)/glutamyl-tRNA(Gln) amidotransferase subunit A